MAGADGPGAPPAARPWVPMTDHILRLEAVSKRFDRTVTADRLSLSVERGEFFTFLGPSGSGKSTILRIVAGLERPDEGRVLIDGTDVSGVPPWRRNLGMVFQHYAIFPHMSVERNVAYGLDVRRLPRGRVRSRVGELLKLVGLSGMGAKNAVLLSGGEQQRVALARALAPSPKLLLLDEPLSALDEKIRREMQDELKAIQRKTGTTFLYVTHDQEEALTMSGRIAVLNRGICVQCDAPERIFARPRTRFVGRFFRGCNVLDALCLGGEGGKVRLRLAGREFLAEGNGGGAAPGTAVGIAIRSEKVAIGPAAAGAEVCLPGTLREAIYRGANVDYAVTLADGQSIVASSARREGVTAGEPVTLGVESRSIVLLEDEPGGGSGKPA